MGIEILHGPRDIDSPTMPHSTRIQAAFICAAGFMSAVACAVICAAAIMVPAPTAVVPVVACCCVALPILMCWRVPAAVQLLRRTPQAHAVARLRRYLDELPEVEHPLGH